MSIQIRSFANPVTTLNPNQAPVLDGTTAAPPSDLFNIIPAATADSVYDLYKAPKVPPDSISKAVIVKSIRLLNTHTAGVKVTLYFNRPNPNGQNRRRLLTPPDVLLPAGFAYIDEAEITLEPGDKIQAKADTPNKIQFVISGVERDAT